MTLFTNITFRRLTTTEAALIYTLIVDPDGSVVWSNYANMQFSSSVDGVAYQTSSLTSTYYNAGSYLLLFSTIDNVNFYLDNCFVFTNGFNSPSMIITYQENTTNKKILNNLYTDTTSYITAPVKNITEHVVNPSVSSDDPCIFPNILVGEKRFNVNGSYVPYHNICLSVKVITDINDPTGSDEPNVPITPTPPNDNNNWIWWVVAAVIFIFLIIGIIVVVKVISNKKKASQEV